MNEPRPPVPGKEKTTKDASNGTTSKSNSNRLPDLYMEFMNRVEKWQTNFSHLLDDQEAIDLLFNFVKEEAGEHSINYVRLLFYFSCEGLKQQSDEKKRRKLIRAISTDIIRDKIEVSTELREKITSIIQRRIPANARVYDDLQKKVKKIIKATIYPTFLQSDAFIRYVEDHRKEFESKPVAISTQTNRNSNVVNKITSAAVSAATAATAVAAAVAAAAAAAKYGDGAAGFSDKTELPPFIPSKNLQTLHEYAELNLSEESTLKKPTTYRTMPKLTSDLLLATENRRLKVLPHGAGGYIYPASFNTSYNPVSRENSERQSCSSASFTDSEVNSKDGKPYIHRKPTHSDDFRRSYVNPPTQQLAIKTAHEIAMRGPGMVSKERLTSARGSAVDPNELFELLNTLKRKQDEDQDDQSILDQHFSLVFPSQSSPGTISPKHSQKYQNHHSAMNSSKPDFVSQTMRHSKSIPMNASTAKFNTTTKKLPHKCSLISIDSGIDSLYSAELPYEAIRKSWKDDLRRIRKPLPGQQTNLMPTSSSHHTNSLPRMHDSSEDYTCVVYTFGDEKIRYRTKIPGKRLALKHFKDISPKKGDFRFFFQTVCDDPDSPVIQEEVINDMDILPLYDGKIMCTVKTD